MKVLCVLVAVVAVACAGTIKGNQANNGVNEGGLHNEGPEEAAPATTVVAKPDATLVAKPDAALVAKPDATLVAKPDAALVAKPDATLVAKPDATLVAKPEATVIATPGAAAVVTDPATLPPLPAGLPGKGKFNPDKFLANLAKANAAVLNANAKVPSVLAAKVALDAIPPKEPFPADKAALVEGSIALDKAPLHEAAAAPAAALPEGKPSSGSGGVIGGNQANNGVNEGGLHNEDKPAGEAAPALAAPAPELEKPAPEAAKPSSGGTIGGNQANNGVNEGGLHN